MRKLCVIAFLILVAAVVNLLSRSPAHGTAWVLERNRAKFGRPFARPIDPPRLAPAIPDDPPTPDARPYVPDRDPRAPHPDFRVGIDERSKDEATLALHRRLAGAITGYPLIPKDRIAFYATAIDPPEFRFRGWYGVLRSVEADGAGHLVTLYVAPHLSSDLHGAVCLPLADYFEIYRVEGRTIRFVGSLDPGKMSGKTFGFMGL